MENINIKQIMDDVKKLQLKESSGHDWWHTLRVYNNAIDIAKNESDETINMQVVELGALMHDFADHKFGYTDEDRTRMIYDFLIDRNVDEETINEVVYIANNISFKGGRNKVKLKSIESKIVQDADRLDAIGAIGIARTFAYGGHADRIIYNPDLDRENLENKESDVEPDTIYHFYEKLLLLKDRMNTEYGTAKAKERHIFMEAYLKQFYEEWDGAR